MSFLQAIVIGLIQGITEMFPVSSLGHTVLVPALIGGSWRRLVTQQASPESPYLAYVVGLHVATALAILWAMRGEWVGIVQGFGRSLLHRRIVDDQGRLAWLIVFATIPVGVLGISLEHQLRTLFAKPLAAACFLTVNGVILLVGDGIRRRSRARRTRTRRSADGTPRFPSRRGTGEFRGVTVHRTSEPGPADVVAARDRGDDRDVDVPAPATTTPAVANARGSASDRFQSRIRWVDAVGIGIVQSAALLAGISRDGICMVGGLWRGLSYEDAARFAFLLSAPPILAAGLLKVPDLMGPLGNGIRGQVLAGSVAAFLTASIAVRALLRWFKSRSLRPFGVYCLLFGISCVLVFA